MCADEGGQRAQADDLRTAVSAGAHRDSQITDGVLLLLNESLRQARQRHEPTFDMPGGRSR
jgi:hypothetical protein